MGAALFGKIFSPIPIQLISATLAEMRLNRTLMEWSINLSVCS